MTSLTPDAERLAEIIRELRDLHIPVCDDAAGLLDAATSRAEVPQVRDEEVTRVVGWLRKFHAEITDSDGGESPQMAMTRRAADLIERLARPSAPSEADVEQAANACDAALSNWLDVPLHRMAVEDVARAALSAIGQGEDERATAFNEAAAEARRYAGHYPQSSDGRNTFILFAEWAESQALASRQAGAER